VLRHARAHAPRPPRNAVLKLVVKKFEQPTERHGKAAVHKKKADGTKQCRPKWL